MIILQEIFKNIIFKRSSNFSVGQRLHSVKTRKVLHLKREVYVNEIKHFSALVENATRENTVLLSEKALNDEHYTIVEKDKKLESVF